MPLNLHIMSVSEALRASHVGLFLFNFGIFGVLITIKTEGSPMAHSSAEVVRPQMVRNVTHLNNNRFNNY